MSQPFVWFDNISAARGETADFLSTAFGWSSQDIEPMTLLSKTEGPFAGVCDPMPEVSGWVPYVEVDELDAGVRSAVAAGGTVIASNLEGPAGTATFIRDPGGAPIAVWKRRA